MNSRKTQSANKLMLDVLYRMTRGNVFNIEDDKQQSAAPKNPTLAQIHNFLEESIKTIQKSDKYKLSIQHEKDLKEWIAFLNLEITDKSKKTSNAEVFRIVQQYITENPSKTQEEIVKEICKDERIDKIDSDQYGTTGELKEKIQKYYQIQKAWEKAISLEDPSRWYIFVPGAFAILLLGGSVSAIIWSSINVKSASTASRNTDGEFPNEGGTEANDPDTEIPEQPDATTGDSLGDNTNGSTNNDAQDSTAEGDGPTAEDSRDAKELQEITQEAIDANMIAVICVAIMISIVVSILCGFLWKRHTEITEEKRKLSGNAFKYNYDGEENEPYNNNRLHPKNVYNDDNNTLWQLEDDVTDLVSTVSRRDPTDSSYSNVDENEVTETKAYKKDRDNDKMVRLLS